MKPYGGPSEKNCPTGSTTYHTTLKHTTPTQDYARRELHWPPGSPPPAQSSIRKVSSLRITCTPTQDYARHKLHWLASGLTSACAIMSFHAEGSKAVARAAGLVTARPSMPPASEMRLGLNLRRSRGNIGPVAGHTEKRRSCTQVWMV